MPGLRTCKTLTVSIDCPADRVYAYIRDGENFPEWLATFVTSASESDTGWVLETNDGPIRWRFAEANEFGVLDHCVTLPSGTEILNPMRVVTNGDGSEVMFTLFQRPEMSDEQFADDAGMVERDLYTLKAVLEVT